MKNRKFILVTLILMALVGANPISRSQALNESRSHGKAGRTMPESSQPGPQGRDKLKRIRNAPSDPGEQDWFLKTDDRAATLYVYELGTGDPVIVLHGGWGAEHSYLLDAVNGLEGSWRFIFYDQRGSMRSPCKLEFISVEKHIQDLETLRKELKLERVTLLAHSMGTYLAMAYLQNYPDRVKNLVLAGALPAQSGRSLPPSLQSARDEAGAAFRRFAERPEVKMLYEQHGSNKKYDERTSREETNLWRISYAAANQFDVTLWKRVKGSSRFYNAEVGNATVRTYSNDYDFTLALVKHPYPITIVNGDHDLADFGNWYYNRRFHEQIPNVEVIILKNAGHNHWIDDPVGFRAALTKGLTKSVSEKD